MNIVPVITDVHLFDSLFVNLTLSRAPEWELENAQHLFELEVKDFLIEGDFSHWRIMTLCRRAAEIFSIGGLTLVTSSAFSYTELLLFLDAVPVEIHTKFISIPPTLRAH